MKITTATELARAKPQRDPEAELRRIIAKQERGYPTWEADFLAYEAANRLDTKRAIRDFVNQPTETDLLVRDFHAATAPVTGIAKGPK